MNIAPRIGTLLADTPPARPPVDEHDLLNKIVLDMPQVVFVGDCLRFICLGLGVCLAALLFRSMRYGPPGLDPAHLRAFRLRAASIGLFVLSSCATEYDRIGDAVTIRLPLNLLALALGAASLARQPWRPPPPQETWLEGPRT